MVIAAQTTNETVSLSRYYPAPREQVFKAWTDPQALVLWFGPHSHKCKIEKLDVRVGGEYQIRLIPISTDTECSGEPGLDSVCAGTFIEVIAPQKLVMTFTWIENGGDIGETLLSIELFEKRGGTELQLTHERIPTEEMRQAHTGGWQGTLECLEEYLQH